MSENEFEGNVDPSWLSPLGSPPTPPDQRRSRRRTYQLSKPHIHKGYIAIIIAIHCLKDIEAEIQRLSLINEGILLKSYSFANIFSVCRYEQAKVDTFIAETGWHFHLGLKYDQDTQVFIMIMWNLTWAKALICSYFIELCHGHWPAVSFYQIFNVLLSNDTFWDRTSFVIKRRVQNCDVRVVFHSCDVLREKNSSITYITVPMHVSTIATVVVIVMVINIWEIISKMSWRKHSAST